MRRPPILNLLESINKQATEKIKRDVTMSTGAAWKNVDAGPNQILRQVILLMAKDYLNTA